MLRSCSAVFPLQCIWIHKIKFCFDFTFGCELYFPGTNEVEQEVAIED